MVIEKRKTLYEDLLNHKSRKPDTLSNPKLTSYTLDESGKIKLRPYRSLGRFPSLD